ncbi:type I restriction-modification system subunit M N-terminal domain-containing protein [Burkholderia sp. Ed8]|uniref:type I restriction-modification system subunit M N-terminal domain-containing protein n=1 Tax=Burkholderia sp. Ed8 TaxID=3112957 RepID=UPI00345C783D
MNQDLKKTLWAAADKLRASMDAAEYKHLVLGLIFLRGQFKNPCSARRKMFQQMSEQPSFRNAS